ncbi:MAG: hypothetical protein LBP76_13965 [Treponema sp.]|nr:hypothetical protein [Treponema sp.]
MKKLLTFSIVFALVCATAFAEVTVTAGAGMSFIPLGIQVPEEGDAEAVAGFGRNGGNTTEIQVNVEGATESGKAGFKFQWRPKISGGALKADELGDNAGIWYKPLDIIRIDAGRFVNNDIRGKVGNGAWFGDYTINRANESDIFKNFDAKAAVMLSAKPIEGLSVYALVNNMTETYNNNPDKINNTTVASKGAQFVWENTQFAVAYALPNIGVVRLQYIGAHPSADLPAIANSKFELAFAYTGMEGLTLDVGGGFSLPFEDVHTVPANVWEDGTLIKPEGKYFPGITAGLGVKYATGPLTANLILGGTFAQTWEGEQHGADMKYEGAFRLRPYVAVQYKLNDTFTAQVEGGFDFYGDSKFSGDSLDITGKGGLNYGFGAGLQTTLAPDCTIKVGITYADGEHPTAIGDNFPSADIDATKLTGAFSVPIIFSVSF